MAPILIDGAEIRDYDMTALRSQFALVSQDVVLFNDSVAANVALGAGIDLARVRDALAGAIVTAARPSPGRSVTPRP